MPSDDGIPVETIVWMVKEAVTESGVSRLSKDQDLRVSSIQIILEVLATKSGGTEISLTVPFIGAQLGVGGKLTRQDTETIDMTLAPPAHPKPRGVRGLAMDKILVNAISTVRDTMASAASGNDPWELQHGIVSLSFGVTKTGSISVGVAGDRSSDMMQTLRLTLEPVQRAATAGGEE